MNDCLLDSEVAAALRLTIRQFRSARRQRLIPDPIFHAPDRWSRSQIEAMMTGANTSTQASADAETAAIIQELEADIAQKRQAQALRDQGWGGRAPVLLAAQR